MDGIYTDTNKIVLDTDKANNGDIIAIAILSILIIIFKIKSRKIRY